MVEHLSPYLYSRNGIYYFCRRIPEDLKSYYKQEKITLSLRTRNAKTAKIKSASLTSQLNSDGEPHNQANRRHRISTFYYINSSKPSLPHFTITGFTY